MSLNLTSLHWYDSLAQKGYWTLIKKNDVNDNIPLSSGGQDTEYRDLNASATYK